MGALPAILALRKEKQEDQEFKVIPNYIGSRLGVPTRSRSCYHVWLWLHSQVVSEHGELEPGLEHSPPQAGPRVPLACTLCSTGARGKTKPITQLHEARTWLPVTAGADAMGRLKAGPWGPRAKAARNQMRGSGEGEPARAHLWARVGGLW